MSRAPPGPVGWRGATEGRGPLALLLALLLPTAAFAGSAPHFSLPNLGSANGYGAVVFESDRLTVAFPHLYQEYTPGDVTPDLLYDTYFGIVSSAGGAWLTDAVSVNYEPGTGIIVVERPGLSNPSLSVIEYNFTPMSYPGLGVAQVLKIRNRGSTTVSGVQLVSLHNWHVGGTEGASSPDATHMVESGSDVSLDYAGPGATDAACSGVYDTVLAGQMIGGGCAQTGDDVVPAFGWRLDDIPPGGEAWVGVFTGAAGGADTWIAGRDAQDWYLDELADWAEWQGREEVPEGLGTDELGVYNQQLAYLRMAQVQEPGDAFGQIPASFPVAATDPEFAHIWNITWVRDGSYAAAALAAAGRTQEAADSLAFLSQGKTGEFRSYVGDADYLVSVCRVYGDGTEWSDTDADGPNVEFDDFGLYLWALGEVRAAGRTDVVELLGPPALDGVADVLIGLIDPNTGLLQPDSSIWERHWNGHQEQFAYSSIQAVAGLTAAANIAEDLGDARAETYRAAARTIEAGILEHLLDANGVIAASKDQLDEGSDYLDLAAVEAFNHGILDPGGAEWAASYAAWDRLKAASGNGYARNDDGSAYDAAEWAVIDLRLAEALRRSCQLEEADALDAWITDQAVLNHDTIPELYNPTTGDYAGPAPMLGFGAGAYVWGMVHRAELESQCLDDSDSGNTPVKDGPCGCGSTGSEGAGIAGMLGVVAGLVLRRRAVLR